MYKSEKFGKIFWVDGDLNLKCCPQWADGTGDFEQTEYVTDWIDWEDVDMKALLYVYKYVKLNFFININPKFVCFVIFQKFHLVLLLIHQQQIEVLKYQERLL